MVHEKFINIHIGEQKRDQDGRKEGCEAHLLPNASKNTSTGGTILIGNQLETGRSTPIQPKLQEISPRNKVRQGKKGIALGSEPLGGICKEEVCMGGPSPWGVSRSSHYLGIPVLGC